MVLLIPQPSDASGLEHFELFSPLHGLVVLVTAGCLASVVALGRRWRGTSRQRPFELALAAAAGVTWLVANGYYLVPERFSVSRALPLHVTDVLGLLGPLVLLFPRLRPLRALLYYWGVGLSTMAFITPDLKAGPQLIGFWFFFAAHLMILLAVAYDLLVRDFRPGWADWRSAVAFSLVYLACMAPLNLALESNYGFLGRSVPGQPSLIDFLPDWPWRIPVMFAMALVAMALLTVPWTGIRGAR